MDKQAALLVSYDSLDEWHRNHRRHPVAQRISREILVQDGIRSPCSSPEAGNALEAALHMSSDARLFDSWPRNLLDERVAQRFTRRTDGGAYAWHDDTES